MKRNFSILTALVVVLFIFSSSFMFSGCSQKNITENGGTDKVIQSPETTTDAGKVVEKAKIVMWTHHGPQKDLEDELVKNYNDSNKDGIEIELNVVADKYADVLNMAMASGEGPDIWTNTGASGTKKAVAMQWAEPLNSYITTQFKSMFPSGVWVENNNMIKGNIYTIPDQAFIFRMIYNKDLFKKAGLDPEAPPKTFDELRQYSKKITEAGGGNAYGLGLPMGDDYFTDVILFNGMGMNAIGSLFGYDYTTGKFDYSVYKPLLQLMIDIRKDGSMMPGELLVNGDQGKAKFAEGQIGIMGAASWDLGVFAGMKMNFEMGVADFPTIDGTPRGKSNVSFGSGYSMSAKCANKEAAWKVMEWIFSKDFMGSYIKETGGISLLKTVADDPAFKPDIKYLDQFAIKSTDAAWPPLVPGLQLQGDKRQTVFIQIMTGAKDMEEALADLTKRTNDAFDKAVTDGTFKKEDFYKPDFDPMKLN